MFLNLFFGDAKIQLDLNRRSPIQWQEDNSPHKNYMREFTITVPCKNIGSQELTILDTWTRVYLPDEQYAGLHLSARVNASDRLRNDDYFEAMLIPAGKEITLLLRFTAIARNCQGDNKDFVGEAIAACPECEVAIYCECRGRKEVYIDKQIFKLNLH